MVAVGVSEVMSRLAFVKSYGTQHISSTTSRQQHIRQMMLHQRTGKLQAGRQAGRSRNGHQASRVVLARADGKGSGREPWDFGRFVSTVAFFNEGALQKSLQGLVDNLARTIGGPSQASTQAVDSVPLRALSPSSSHTVPVPIDGVILVTGVEGGVGERVVGKLLSAGKRVRVLTRDKSATTQRLNNIPAAPSASLEIVSVPPSPSSSLPTEALQDVRAVICCAASDTAGSAHTELRTVQTLITSLGEKLGLEQGVPLLQADGSGPKWGPLDDVVMGGVSISTIQSVQGAGEGGAPAMVFKGTVSTSNSGGFASVRCRNFDPPLDLGAYQGVQIRVKGNGLRYKMIVRPDSNWDGIAYCYSFDTKDGEWQTIQVPFRQFFPVFRARRVRDGEPLNTATISSVQLMLSKFEYDGELNPAFKAGPFELPIVSLSAYLPEPARLAPRFVYVASGDQVSGAEGVLSKSGVPYAVVRTGALTDEPRGMPLQVTQGQAGTAQGKVGCEDVAELSLALLSSPQTRDTTLTVTSTLDPTQTWQVDSTSPPPARDWSATLKGIQPGATRDREAVAAA